MVSLQNALKQFLGDLDEIEGGAKFIADTYRILGRSGNYFAMDYLGHGERETLESFRRGKNVSATIFYQALYMHVSAAFELFVRNMIERSVDSLNEFVKSYDELDASYSKKNIFYTGKAFQDIFQNRSAIDFDFFEISKKIGTCHPGSASFSLNSKVFTIYVTDLSAGKLADALQRINVKWNWDLAGRDSGLKELFNSNKNRETAQLAERFLNDFVRSRNHIVHKGDLVPSLTEGDVIRAVAYFRRLSPLVCEEAKRTVAKSVAA